MQYFEKITLLFVLSKKLCFTITYAELNGTEYKNVASEGKTGFVRRAVRIPGLWIYMKGRMLLNMYDFSSTTI